MNKIKCLAVLILLAAGPLAAGTLTVVKPNGGESLTLGQANCQIQWAAVGVAQNVRINLLKGGAVVGAIATSLPPGSSPFLWTAGRLADGTMVQAGSDYKVRVRAIDSSESDESDGLFSLVNLAPPPPPVMLKLETPNGGNALLLHHETEIAWKSIAPDSVGKVRLQLMKEGCCTIGILAENLPATGTFAWKAGEYPGHTAPAGKYRIRVSSMADPKVYDESDDAFELKSLAALAGKTKQMKVLMGETVPAVYQNFPCQDTFPSNVSNLPITIWQQGYQQMFASGCGISNATAQVGAYWFPYQNIYVASLYRSRIHFPLSKFADRAGALTKATLKMKRLHSVHEDANSGCGCSENLWVLEAPMTSCKIPAIGQRIDIALNMTEFSRDVTEIVRQWLDGTLANHGLLLLAGESPCSGGRKCVSCYEASLILNFK